MVLSVSQSLLNALCVCCLDVVCFSDDCSSQLGTSASENVCGKRHIVKKHHVTYSGITGILSCNSLVIYELLHSRTLNFLFLIPHWSFSWILSVPI